MGEDFKCQSALVGGLVPSTFLSACGATIFPKRGISHIILKVFLARHFGCRAQDPTLDILVQFREKKEKAFSLLF